MKAILSERPQAEQMSAVVDRLIGDPEAQLPPMGAEADLIGTARRLARLPALLGPSDPALEQRILLRSWQAAGLRRTRRGPAMRMGWAVAALAVLVLLGTLLTPLGQTAVASFMAVFQLGRTEVRITPIEPSVALATAAVAQATAVQSNLSLAEAQRLAFPILQPAVLPAGYTLRDLVGYSYPDLPAWVPQPFSIQLVYADDEGHEFELRLYPITLGEEDRLEVSRLNLEATSIQDVRDVDLNGRPAVLLRVGQAGGKVAWQEVVWEQGNLLLSLSTQDLPEAELLRVAGSVR